MNKVMLIGNLTRDVEKRETATGKAVANFSIAVGRTFSDETDFSTLRYGKNKPKIALNTLKKVAR